MTLDADLDGDADGDVDGDVDGTDTGDGMTPDACRAEAARLLRTPGYLAAASGGAVLTEQERADLRQRIHALYARAEGASRHVDDAKGALDGEDADLSPSAASRRAEELLKSPGFFDGSMPEAERARLQGRIHALCALAEGGPADTDPETVAQADLAQRMEHGESLHALRDEWGPRFDEKLQCANSVIASVILADKEEAFLERFGNNARMIRALAEIGELLQEA